MSRYLRWHQHEEANKEISDQNQKYFDLKFSRFIKEFHVCDLFIFTNFVIWDFFTLTQSQLKNFLNHCKSLQ